MIDKLLSNKTATVQSYNKFQQRVNSDWGLSGHDIGIHDFNMAIGGWVRGKLTTLAARSRSGKTLTTVPMMEAAGRIVANRRAEILFCTWEMQPTALIDRAISRFARVSGRMFQQGAKILGEDSYVVKNLQQSYKKAQDMPVHYQEMTLDIEKMKSLVSAFCAMVRKKEIDEGIEIIPVIIIDFLNMATLSGSQNKTYGIQDYMIGLKQLANNEGASIMPLAQISREVDKFGRQTNKVVEPTLADLSDSKSIEDLSDNVILMHNPMARGGFDIRDPETQEMISAKGLVLFKVEKCRDFGSSEFLCRADMRFFDVWHRFHQPLYDYTHLYKSKEFWTEQLKGEIKTSQLF